MTDADPKVLSDEATVPIPPRYWWLKRILLAAGILILALAMLRWWGGWEAERRLQAKIAEYRTAGQPMAIEDFQLPPVPDEENAAVLYRKAAAAITTPAESPVSAHDVCGEIGDAAVWAKYADDITRLMEANAEPLRLLRQARGMARANWNVPVSQSGLMAALPEFSAQRGVARLLAAAAQYHHRRGDHAEAVSTLRDALAHSGHFGKMQGFLVTHLIVAAIDALATSETESVIPTLVVSDGAGSGSPGIAPARREEVCALLEELLDEQLLRESWRWAVYGGRLLALEYTDMATSGTGGLAALGGPALPNPITFALRPMFQLDGVFMLECYTQMVDAGVAENYPAAVSLAVRYPRFRSGIERNAHLFSAITLPSLEHAPYGLFRALMRRRFAAAALAIHLFELDHGQRPGSLDELVPEYLPQVPPDPFAADGRPLSYLPDAPKPRLYSVGRDGKDDGGTYEIDPDGHLIHPLPDFLFFLDGDRPRGPSWLLTRQVAATQAVEDQHDVVGNSGEADQDGPGGDEP